MSERKTGAVLPIAVTLAVLIGLYVGAYYGMAKPIGTIVPAWRFSEPWETLDPTDIRYCHRLDVFFSPMIWFDRRICRHVWEPMP